jgi:hypothetical protein
MVQNKEMLYRHCLSTLLQIISNVQEKLGGIHQLLICTGKVNLLGDNTDTIKEKAETLTDVTHGSVVDEALQYKTEGHGSGAW